MTTFSEREQLALNAAEGWLMLGCPREAAKELEAVRAENADSPEALCLRWAISFRLKRWKEARSIARLWCWTAPDELEAWVALANATRECDGLHRAKKILLEAAERFPGEWIIPYNLACHCAQLGEIAEAVLWLNNAMEQDATRQVRQDAAADPDLIPLWEALMDAEAREPSCVEARKQD